MSKKSEAVTVSDAKQLLEYVELEGIETYEVSARLVERAEGFEEDYFIKAGIRFDSDALRTRFTLTFSAAAADFTADLAVKYRLDEDVTVGRQVAVEFAEKVGVMAAWPFLREHVFGLASRIGQPVPVLGLLRQGEFSLTPDEPAPDTAAISTADIADSSRPSAPTKRIRRKAR